MKKFKNLISFLIVLCLLVCIFPTNTFAAKKPKISKNSLTINVGKTSTLKVKNSSKSWKWSSSEKAIATVSSKGVVTGVSTGSCYIYAKNGKTKLYCYVTVKFDSSASLKNIKVSYDDDGENICALITNNNSYAISVSGKMLYYNNGGIMIDTVTEENYCLDSGATCALIYHYPLDSDYNRVTPADYDLKLTLDSSVWKGYSKKISTDYTLGLNSVIVEAKNNSSTDLDFVNISCLMYDVSGNLIGSECYYADSTSAGSSSYLEFSYPYDSSYDSIIPDHCKIYVNWAYNM